MGDSTVCWMWVYFFVRCHNLHDRMKQNWVILQIRPMAKQKKVKKKRQSTLYIRKGILHPLLFIVVSCSMQTQLSTASCIYISEWQTCYFLEKWGIISAYSYFHSLLILKLFKIIYSFSSTTKIVRTRCRNYVMS